jgi:general secretion pathway protein D
MELQLRCLVYLIGIGLVFGTYCPVLGSDPVDVRQGPHMPMLEAPGAAEQLISLDLNRVDIRIFIKTVSQLTGINFLVDDKIQGTVTLMSPTQVRVGQIYHIFESVLETHGYAAVVSGEIVKIVPRSVAVKANLPLFIGADPDAISRDDQLVTQIIPLQHIQAAKVNTVISSMTTTGGQVTAFAGSNTIIITDSSSSIHRIAKILNELDVPQPSEGIEYIHLHYASAQRTSDQIMEIIQRSQKQTGAFKKRVTPEPGKERIKILADDRTNSLVVMATAEDMETVQCLIKSLDVESPLEAGHVHVIYLQHAEANQVEESVSAALGRLTTTAGRDEQEPFQITADESTNSLIVVAPPQDFKVVQNMVEKLDVVREQVLVEFKIVEISRDLLQEIGVDWTTLDEAVADSIRGFAYNNNVGARVEAAGGNISGLIVGLQKQVGGQTKIGAILKALEKNSGVNVLSTPHILTSNHQEASISVADNVPYVRQSRVTDADVAATTAIRTFDFKDVGIDLKVRPHISAGGFVRMEIEASFSKLIEGATGLGNETPTTAQRTASTVISIMSGATVVIGGLMRDDKETIEQKVPIIGDIPLVGALFRYDKERLLKTNLMLFITPHVLTDREDLVEITQRKQAQQQHVAAQESFNK